MSSIRRKYTREFKVEAVRLITGGVLSLAQASRDLDVGESVLRRWRQELVADAPQAFPGSGRLKPDEEEVRRLRRECARLREERDILKEAVAIFSRPRR